jgi:hypothetical protein
MELIEDMWKNFSLSDKEGLNVDLANTSQQPKNILAAKFLMSHVLNIRGGPGQGRGGRSP